jgi:S-DNA-T family DNA segregation ATPase FtsK/SpoIIIE
VRKSKSPKKPEKNMSNRGPKQGIGNEVFGLILIAMGILIGLALISYDQGDPVGSLSEGNIYKIQNWLGLFGATIAAPLFQWTIGYPILSLSILLIILGFHLLVKRSVKNLRRFAVLLISWSIFFSICLALPEALRTLGNFHTFYPSGFLGGTIAAYLVIIFSKFGAIFILFVSFFMLLILTFHFRISIIPIIIGKFLSVVIKLYRKSENKIKVVITSLSHRYKRKEEPIEDRLDLDSNRNYGVEQGVDPRYHPSLPSEKELQDRENEKSMEIVHQRDRKANKQFISSEVVEFIGEEEKIVKENEELGFEVQEAHIEKELDYDSLVKDSMSKYQFPSTDLLIEQDSEKLHMSEEELRTYAHLVEETLRQFGVRAVVNRVVEGPVITLYEVKPAEGVKISQIVGLADDLALAMRAKGIRMIAPIPGKAAIGIEIPNREPSIVYYRSIVRSETFINFEAKLPLGMGKTISGEVYCTDLTKMPHLLIAGATGSGKSVGINTMISSLLYRVPPSELKFVMIDPKKLELSIYTKLKDQYLAVCPELNEIIVTHPQNAIMMLRSVVNEMDSRYDKLAAMAVREISHYNRKIEEYHQKGETSDDYRKLPYLVVVIDELADLMLTAAREVEEPITRLAQMARAVGIHLIMATQRPSVDIITGLIKANFPARIAYQVATRPDSKVILDMYGAEKLIGNGDMLFLPPGKVKPIRLQNPLITTEEVERIIKHINMQPKFPPYELKLFQKREGDTATKKIFERDELYEKAKSLVIQYQQGSVSLLQRKLKIGYARAARIVDELEEAGIVGPPLQEGKAREVLVSAYSPDK